MESLKFQACGKLGTIAVVAALALTSLAMGPSAHADPACVAAVQSRVPFTETFKGDAFQVRIAAAEFLALHAPGSSAAHISDAQTAAFLRGVATNKLTPEQANLLPQYEPLLASLMQTSKALGRLRILEAYDGGVPTNISQILSSAAEPKRPGFLKRFLPFGKKAETLEFLNAEQFAQALETYSPEHRLAELTRAAGSLPLLTHMELLRVLMALPKEQQLQADRLLATRVFGSLDLFPKTMLEDAALELAPEVLARYIRSSGSSRPLTETVAFLRQNGLGDLRIIEALPNELVQSDRILEAFRNEANLSLKDALFWLHVAGGRSPSQEPQVRRVGEALKERLPSTFDKEELDSHLTRLLEAANGFVSFNRISGFDSRRALSAAIHGADAGSAIYLLHYIDTTPQPRDLRKMTSWESGPSSFTRDQLNTYLTREKQFLNGLSEATNAKWTTEDLIAMGFVDLSATLTGITLQNLKGAVKVDQAYELRSHVVRLFNRGIRDLPHANSLRSSKARPGVTLEDLRTYLISLIDKLPKI